MYNNNDNGVKSSPASADNYNDFFNGLAKQLGVKRYSKEYNRFLWVNLLGVSPEVYDKTNNR